MLLPVDRYKAGESLPPHLSPFVDDETEGHMPSYAADIQKLKEIRSAAEDKVALAKELMPKPVVKDERMAAVARKRAQEEADNESTDEDDSEDEDEAEDREAAQLRSDVRRAKQGKGVEEEEEEEDEESDDDEDEASDEEEEAKEAVVEEKKTKKSKTDVDTTPNKKLPAAAAAAAAAETKEVVKAEVTFVKSKKFAGAKPGFVFKKGSKGVGYYKDVLKKVTFVPGKNAGMSKRERMRQERVEAKRLREMMMNNKAKRLYGKMQHGIEEKKNKLDHLKRKRDMIEQEYSQSGSASKKKKNKGNKRK
jgi:hypothetical protein